MIGRYRPAKFYLHKYDWTGHCIYCYHSCDHAEPLFCSGTGGEVPIHLEDEEG